MPPWTDSERKLLPKAQKEGLTSTPKRCPNPMEAYDVMGEELRTQGAHQVLENRLRRNLR